MRRKSSGLRENARTEMKNLQRMEGTNLKFKTDVAGGATPDQTHPYRAKTQYHAARRLDDAMTGIL